MVCQAIHGYFFGNVGYGEQHRQQFFFVVTRYVCPSTRTTACCCCCVSISQEPTTTFARCMTAPRHATTQWSGGTHTPPCVFDVGVCGSRCLFAPTASYNGRQASVSRSVFGKTIHEAVSSQNATVADDAWRQEDIPIAALHLLPRFLLVQRDALFITLGLLSYNAKILPVWRVAR